MVYTIRVQRHVKMPPKSAIASCTLPYWVVSAHSWSQEPSQNPLSLDNWDHGDPFSFSFPEYGTFGSSWDCKVSIRISCQTCWVTFNWHREKQVEKNHHRTAFGQTVQIRKVGLPESITHFWMTVKISRKKYTFSICIFLGSKIFQKYAFFHGEMPMCIFFGLAAENAYFLDCPNQHFTELCIFDGSKTFQKYAFSSGKFIFFAFWLTADNAYFIFRWFCSRFSWNYAFLMVPRFSKNKYFFHGKMHMFAFRLAAENANFVDFVEIGACILRKGENMHFPMEECHQKCINPWKPWFGQNQQNMK